MPPTLAPLYVDLVPRTAWFENLRAELSAAEWAQVRAWTYRVSDCRCEACGGRGPDHPVEAHERWQFDLKTGVQTLLGISALCPDCHEATHYGFARTQGRGEFAIEWLMHVNGWTRIETSQHVAVAMDAWRVRSARRWQLDARWLLGQFPAMSAATREKIEAHAAGLPARAQEAPTASAWREPVPSRVPVVGRLIDHVRRQRALRDLMLSQ
jgi:hypothetical protein